MRIVAQAPLNSSVSLAMKSTTNFAVASWFVYLIAGVIAFILFVGAAAAGHSGGGDNEMPILLLVALMISALISLVPALLGLGCFKIGLYAAARRASSDTYISLGLTVAIIAAVVAIGSILVWWSFVSFCALLIVSCALLSFAAPFFMKNSERG